MNVMKNLLKCALILCTGIVLMAQQPPPVKPAPVKPAPTQAPTPAPAAATLPPDSVVLTIGEEKLSRIQFEQLLAGLPDNVRASAASPAGKRQLAQQLGELMAIAQEARKRKLDQSPIVQQMITVQTDQVLASTLARQISNEVAPDDAALHNYYDTHKSQYEQAKASHILIRFKGSKAALKPNEKDLTEEEALAKAQDLRKKLLAGADFAATAKAESDDGGSAEKGGSLGTFNHGEMVPPFEQAAFALPLGQISEPVKTEFGYHLIKVDERPIKTFAEAKPDIERQLKPQTTQKALDSIKTAAGVTLNEAYFGK
jgi:parvulin-like peptidyl-prolyl isomerase